MKATSYPVEKSKRIKLPRLIWYEQYGTVALQTTAKLATVVANPTKVWFLGHQLTSFETWVPFHGKVVLDSEEET